jgi:hypothetical protein
MPGTNKQQIQKRGDITHAQDRKTDKAKTRKEIQAKTNRPAAPLKPQAKHKRSYLSMHKRGSALHS